MDLHIVPGITAKGAAEAHRQDLLIQKEYGCNCMTYWVDESRNSAFCLIDAPNPQKVKELHDKAHGLMTHQIIEVNSTVVESFLGRIYDPETSDVLESQLKVFNDPAFRVLLVINNLDTIILTHRLGREKVKKIVSKYKKFLQRQAEAHGGREVEYTDVNIISFTSTFNAVACAIAMQKVISKEIQELLNVKMSVHAGMPVATSSELFGDTIQFAKRLFYTINNKQIAVASIIKEITHKNYFNQINHQIITLSTSDEKILDQLLDVLEKESGNSNFNVTDFCKHMGVSKSGLYRITEILIKKSPNLLIKEFRLEKAMELMRNSGLNVSQAAFDSGFSSPGYFSKCFLETYHFLPSAYKRMC
ncbi:nickel-binding protein [Gramella sp. AN32]|uniref:Nickel-binding protein n=1 Tax=Christiangramia antarctica TaxID=2058158 RepID=A0ABW5X966_9FLAO|nr:nickel-binding protein [Gramella sp. AN32]MCM4155334.1 DUF4242 domain-containing protein [Gramella sp. AN32]